MKKARGKRREVIVVQEPDPDQRGRRIQSRRPPEAKTTMVKAVARMERKEGI